MASVWTIFEPSRMFVPGSRRRSVRDSDVRASANGAETRTRRSTPNQGKSKARAHSMTILITSKDLGSSDGEGRANCARVGTA